MKLQDLEKKLKDSISQGECARDLISAVAEVFASTQADSAKRDILFYVSGKRLWDDDESSGEKEFVVLECVRRIDLDSPGTETVEMTVCLEFPLESVPGIETFQSEWCVEKTRIQEWILEEVKRDLTYQALELKSPDRVKCLIYPVVG